MVDFDVVIIGGGVSGLQCLKTLKKTTNSVLLLEANDYLGGRVKQTNNNFYLYEEGAEYIHCDKTRPMRKT